MRAGFRALAAAALAAAIFACSPALGAAAPTRLKIGIPSRSLAVMPFYFGKDKGFFAREGIELELVLMPPPTAIAALVAGELEFSITLGAGTSAIMRGHPLKRLAYVQQDPTFSLVALPEIKSVQELKGKVVAVVAPSDATGMSLAEILKAHGVDPSTVPFLGGRSMENVYVTLTGRKVAAAMLSPPFAEEAESKRYHRMAEAKDHAPLSAIGLMSSTAYLKKEPAKVEAMLTALVRTMAYLQDQANRAEIVQYIASVHRLDRTIAEKAFAGMLTAYSRNGSKPRAAVQKEIEIYRETLKVDKMFSPEDLEDMRVLRRVQDVLGLSTRRGP